MNGSYLVLAGTFLMLVSAGYEYYLKKQRANAGNEIDEELTQLQERDSIDPEELPAIGSSKETQEKLLRISMVGYVLGFFLVVIGLYFSDGPIITCYDFLRYSTLWALILGFFGATTWYIERRIFDWNYFPEFRITMAVLAFIPNLLQELCSIGVL